MFQNQIRFDKNSTSLARLRARRDGLWAEHAGLTEKLDERTKRDQLFSQLQSILHWRRNWRELDVGQKALLSGISANLGGFYPRIIDGFCAPVDVSKIQNPAAAENKRREMEREHDECFRSLLMLIRSHQLAEGARRSRIYAERKALGAVSGKIGRALNKARRPMVVPKGLKPSELWFAKPNELIGGGAGKVRVKTEPKPAGRPKASQRRQMEVTRGR